MLYGLFLNPSNVLHCFQRKVHWLWSLVASVWKLTIHWSTGAKDVCLLPKAALLKVGQSQSCVFSFMTIIRPWLADFTELDILCYIYPRMLCTSLVLDASFCLQEAQWPMRKTIFSSLDFTSSLPTHFIILWNMIFVLGIQLQHLIQVISI